MKNPNKDILQRIESAITHALDEYGKWSDSSITGKDQKSFLAGYAAGLREARRLIEEG